MTNCQQIVEFLSAYLEGDLDTITIEIIPFIGIERECVVLVCYFVAVCIVVSIVSDTVAVHILRFGGVAWESIRRVRNTVVVIVIVGVVADAVAVSVGPL